MRRRYPLQSFFAYFFRWRSWVLPGDRTGKPLAFHVLADLHLLLLILRILYHLPRTITKLCCTFTRKVMLIYGCSLVRYSPPYSPSHTVPWLPFEIPLVWEGESFMRGGFAPSLFFPPLSSHENSSSYTMVLAGEGQGVRYRLVTRCKQNSYNHPCRRHKIGL